MDLCGDEMFASEEARLRWGARCSQTGLAAPLRCLPPSISSPIPTAHVCRTAEQTPYEGGTWRIKLVLGQDYPQAPPRGFFLTKIYHPNVSANGDICVNTLKKDWNDSVTLSHILAVIRCLLIVPFPESSLNDEAGKLFMDSYDDYADRARIMTQIHAVRKGGGAAKGGSEGASSTTMTTVAAELVAKTATSTAEDGASGAPTARRQNAEDKAPASGSGKAGDKASSASSVEASSGVKPKAKENSVNGKAVPKEKKKQKENKKKGLKRL